MTILPLEDVDEQNALEESGELNLTLVQAWYSALQGIVVQSGVHAKYKFDRTIGEGSYGRVFLANGGVGDVEQEVRRRTVAIKVLDIKKMVTSFRTLDHLTHEIRVHWALAECDGVLNL